MTARTSAAKRSNAASGSGDWVEHLRGVPLFADVQADSARLSELTGLLKEKSFKPGETIIQEGEAGAEMYLLTEGKAEVLKSTAEGENYKVAILDAKDRVAFGEGALLDSEARTATIQAATACRCLVLHRADFEKFATAHPEFGLPVYRRIARAVMGRLRKTNEDLSLLYHALVAEIRGR
ncbi:MAG TPA: cyclic nucleotide-binding domain-containing protein [Bdellovibrionota bacterium]|nr:cyclic nucleotide-binding domain-containing protein [Bdellovibrionota bacterium]